MDHRTFPQNPRSEEPAPTTPANVAWAETNLTRNNSQKRVIATVVFIPNVAESDRGNWIRGAGGEVYGGGRVGRGLRRVLPVTSQRDRPTRHRSG